MELDLFFILVLTAVATALPMAVLYYFMTSPKFRHDTPTKEP
jgi:hypothetical protein